jgi:hypothetical protein
MIPQPMTLAFFLAVLLAPALALVAGTARPASANGAAFFDEGAADNPNGTVYFGFVKTARGKALKGADVKITVKGKDKPEAYIIHSNVIGIYRSTRVANTIDPRLVEVTAWKKGYKLVGKVKRSRSTQAGAPVQYDFIFQAVD